MTLRNMTSIYLSKGGRILLLYREGSRVVNQVWIGSAGGHFEENELNNPEACVLRELQEELGITDDQIENLSLRYITLRRSKEEIRQNYFFFADLKDEINENLISNEGKSKWFYPEEISAVDMPFSAKHVMEHYLKIGKNDDKLYGGVGDGSKVVFVELADF